VIVVSDSSPLHYLIQINKVEILHTLFGEVIIPGSVREELECPSAPSDVREWLKSPPTWARFCNAAVIDTSLTLGKGEREAICLALELNADLLLVDDKKARRFADQQGLTVTGIIGILQVAHDRGLVKLPEAVRELLQRGFRLSEKLARQICSEQINKPNDIGASESI
jgi:predicted nucleic acid-binding protein